MNTSTFRTCAQVECDHSRSSRGLASNRKNLDRHWRAIRTLSLHNPTLYKALSIGKFLVNDEPLPFNGYF